MLDTSIQGLGTYPSTVAGEPPEAVATSSLVSLRVAMLDELSQWIKLQTWSATLLPHQPRSIRLTQASPQEHDFTPRRDEQGNGPPIDEDAHRGKQVSDFEMALHQKEAEATKAIREAKAQCGATIREAEGCCNTHIREAKAHHTTLIRKAETDCTLIIREIEANCTSIITEAEGCCAANVRKAKSHCAQHVGSIQQS